MSVTKAYMLWILLLLPGLLSAGNGNGQSGPYARLTLQHGKAAAIKLTVEQAPWEQIFSEIAKTTGALMHYSALPAAKVTATCVGTTLKQVMECLLAPEADFIFRYSDGGQQHTAHSEMPAEIWVLKSSFGTLQPSSSNKDSTICKAIAGQDNTTALCKQTNTTAGAEQNAPDRTAQLLDSVNTTDAAQRADAIASLATEGRPDDAAVHEALYAALSDENPDVRAQAVFGLAQRKGTTAVTALQQAMQDSDAAVRLMAVDSAGENAALLQNALNDNDKAVRELAALKLEALSKTNTTQ